MRKDGRAAASAMWEGKRITKYGKTKTEAKQKLDAHLSDLRSGKVVTSSKQTVEQYLTHWLEDEHRLLIRVGTLVKYRADLRVHLIPAFGHLQLSSLTRQHIQAFVMQKLDQGKAPRSVKNMYHLLAHALDAAVRDGLLPRNPCQYVTLPREVKYEARPLTSEECQTLIKVTHGHWFWPFILLAVVTGARHGELSALRWSDVDLAKGEIYIHRTVKRQPGYGYVENEAKTVAGMRRVRIPQVAIDALYEQKQYVERVSRSALWKEHDLVFPGRWGSYLNAAKNRKRFKVLLRQAGLPAIRLHDLRHSAATLLLASGVNAKVIQELLGHSNISITLGMYAHVMPNMTEEVTIKMEGLFGKHNS